MIANPIMFEYWIQRTRRKMTSTYVRTTPLSTIAESDARAPLGATPADIARRQFNLVLGYPEHVFWPATMSPEVRSAIGTLPPGHPALILLGTLTDGSAACPDGTHICGPAACGACRFPEQCKHCGHEKGLKQLPWWKRFLLPGATVVVPTSAVTAEVVKYDHVVLPAGLDATGLFVGPRCDTSALVPTVVGVVGKPCQYGADCRKAVCPFQHPVEECPFGAGCRFQDKTCKRVHPPARPAPVATPAEAVPAATPPAGAPAPGKAERDHRRRQGHKAQGVAAPAGGASAAAPL